MTTPKSYQLIQCQHQQKNNNCKLCGVYLTSEILAYKTLRYITNPQQSNQRYLRNLKKKVRQLPVIAQIYSNTQSLFQFLQKIVQKFQFSIQTFALGIYIFNKLISTSNKTQYITEAEFYSSVSLMVAAKAIEFDKNIPYYTRYQKYACKNHTKEEYQNLQKQIIQYFEFQIQIPTFVTFLHFYLSNGIVFSDQNFNKRKVFLVQQKIKELMHKNMKNGEFLKHNPQKFAANILNEARKQFKLKWHPAIQQYSKLSLNSFQQNHHQQILKPIYLQQPKQNIKGKYQSISHKQKQFGSTIKAKQKNILNKMKINNLRSVPSFHTLNILSLKKLQL